MLKIFIPKHLTKFFSKAYNNGNNTQHAAHSGGLRWVFYIIRNLLLTYEFIMQEGTRDEENVIGNKQP